MKKKSSWKKQLDNLKWLFCKVNKLVTVGDVEFKRHDTFVVMSDNNKNSDQLHIKRFSNLVQDHQHLDSYVKYCTQQLEEEIPFFISFFKQNKIVLKQPGGTSYTLKLKNRKDVQKDLKMVDLGLDHCQSFVQEFFLSNTSIWIHIHHVENRVNIVSLYSSQWEKKTKAFRGMNFILCDASIKFISITDGKRWLWKMIQFYKYFS